MGLIQSFIEKAQHSPRRIVLPESGDDRVVAAAKRLHDEGIAHPILVGEAPSAPEVASVDPQDFIESYASSYVERRGTLSQGAAKRMLKRPTYFGAAMVAHGDADALVAGVTGPTAHVIAAGSLLIDLEPGVSTPSSFFLMVFPGTPERVIVYADAASVVDPTSEELADIGVSTARNASRLLDFEPRVAFLSLSTHGSAQHPHVTKVQDAVALAKEKAPDLCIDGELQADSAISPKVAASKCPDSPLKGEANILIFPDLNSGNIAYKLTQYLAGAQAVGPIMQGFRKPVNDLSRGASVDDIVAVCAISSLQAGE